MSLLASVAEGFSNQGQTVTKNKSGYQELVIQVIGNGMLTYSH